MESVLVGLEGGDRMHRRLLGLSLVLAGVLISASMCCGCAPEPRIVGDWTNGAGASLTFTGDGKFVFAQDDRKTAGGYELINDETLLLSASNISWTSGATGDELTCDFTWDGETFALDDGALTDTALEGLLNDVRFSRRAASGERAAGAAKESAVRLMKQEYPDATKVEVQSATESEIREFWSFVGGEDLVAEYMKAYADWGAEEYFACTVQLGTTTKSTVCAVRRDGLGWAATVVPED